MQSKDLMNTLCMLFSHQRMQVIGLLHMLQILREQLVFLIFREALQLLILLFLNQPLCSSSVLALLAWLESPAGNVTDRLFYCPVI